VKNKRGYTQPFKLQHIYLKNVQKISSEFTVKLIVEMLRDSLVFSPDDHSRNFTPQYYDRLEFELIEPRNSYVMLRNLLADYEYKDFPLYTLILSASQQGLVGRSLHRNIRIKFPVLKSLSCQRTANCTITLGCYSRYCDSDTSVTRANSVSLPG
jgi:hypothetical protein